VLLSFKPKISLKFVGDIEDEIRKFSKTTSGIGYHAKKAGLWIIVVTKNDVQDEQKLIVSYFIKKHEARIVQIIFDLFGHLPENSIEISSVVDGKSFIDDGLQVINGGMYGIFQ